MVLMNPQATAEATTPKLPRNAHGEAWGALARTHAAITGRLQEALAAADFPPLPWYEVLATVAEAPEQRMKREISELFGEEYARLAVILNDARGWAKGTLPTYQDRKEFFEGIVNGDPDPIELLRQGEETAVLAIIESAKERAAAALA